MASYGKDDKRNEMLCLLKLTLLMLREAVGSGYLQPACVYQADGGSHMLISP